MNTTLQRSFDAIESALANLIESITSNDPSPTAALSLVAADDELSSNLEDLVTHQCNHEQILHLRSTSAALDQELTNLLTTLSDTRSSLVSVPSTTFSSTTRDVPYTELLQYATKISKFTSSSQPIPTTSSSINDKNRDKSDHNESQSAVGGGQYSVEKGESINHKDDSSNNANNSDNNAVNPQFSTGTNPAIKPTIEEAAMLNPNHAMIGVFAPWPSEEVMRRGILARVAYEGESGGTSTTQQDQQQQLLQQQSTEPQQQQQLIKQTGYGARDREEAGRRESEKKAKEEAVFTGLDLYVSDDE